MRIGVIGAMQMEIDNLKSFLENHYLLYSNYLRHHIHHYKHNPDYNTLKKHYLS